MENKNSYVAGVESQEGLKHQHDNTVPVHDKAIPVESQEGLKHSEPPEALCQRGRRDLESQIKAAVGRLAELRNCNKDRNDAVCNSSGVS